MSAIHLESDAAVSHLTDLVPPATLTEARVHRDDLARLLGRERVAATDFLLALADFDRRRGWEPLGHASLFAFLTRELRLSNGAAYLRLTAARLLPRFFGRSSREAREVAAAILPHPSPPRREVVSVVPAPAPARMLDLAASSPSPSRSATDAAPAPTAAAKQLRAHEVAPTHPARGVQAAVEPLSADLRRLHVTVSARFIEKVSTARDGLSHTLPGATTEQVLEAALDLLLEKQARAKALVKRPRTPTSPPTSTSAPTPTTYPNPNPTSRHIPAPIEREVRLRDGDRCQFPLDSGGVCGSTWQVQLDHIMPRVLDGPTTVANLRCACSVHNRYAAELALGPAAARVRRRCE